MQSDSIFSRAGGERDAKWHVVGRVNLVIANEYK